MQNFQGLGWDESIVMQRSKTPKGVLWLSSFLASAALFSDIINFIAPIPNSECIFFSFLFSLSRTVDENFIVPGAVKSDSSRHKVNDSFNTFASRHFSCDLCSFRLLLEARGRLSAQQAGSNAKESRVLSSRELRAPLLLAFITPVKSSSSMNSTPAEANG